MGTEERLILEMLREGKISVEDAERLLGAVRNGDENSNRGFSSLLESNWWEEVERSLGETLSKVESRISRAVSDLPQGNIRMPLRGLKRKRQREEQGFTPVELDGQSFGLPSDARVIIDIEGSDIAIEEATGEAEISFDREGHDWEWSVLRMEDTYVVSVFANAVWAGVPNVSLRLPPVRTLACQITGGSMSVHNLTPPLDASVAGGSMQLTGVTGELKLHSAGGAIGVLGKVPSLQAETAGGPISLQGSADRLSVKSVGGNVSINHALLLEGDHSVESAGGGVVLVLDPKSAVSIEAAAAGGGVDASLPGASGEVRNRYGTGQYNGALGAGTAKLQLRSSGGSIRIYLSEESDASDSDTAAMPQ
jgi:hypothetical protein